VRSGTAYALLWGFGHECLGVGFDGRNNFDGHTTLDQPYPLFGPAARQVYLGLGRIVALYHRSSTSYQIR
jgi:hypothetical protein